MTNRITFYSYKGGTGRSTVMCNIAYELAVRGYSVGCVDCDFEAAGITYIFDVPKRRIKMLNNTQDYLLEEARKTKGSIEEAAYDVGKENGQLEIKNSGDLYLLTSAVDADKASRIPTNKNTIYPCMLEMFKEFESYDGGLDFLLVDSRSGISNFALPAVSEADRAVLFMKWTDQHRRGTEKACRWIKEDGGVTNQHLIINSVPENIEQDRIRKWIEEDSYVEIDQDKRTIVREDVILKTEERILTAEERDTETTRKFSKIADEFEKMV